MNEFKDQLASTRNELGNQLLDGQGKDAVLKSKDVIERNVGTIQLAIEAWWAIYEKWESKDTFNDAYQDNRMSVRTFDAGFQKQVSKTFEKGSINIASDSGVRMFADSQYTPFGGTDAEDHNARFRGAIESKKYYAQRGIDGSAFANPENFTSRETKYSAGLHDLSASLLNKDVSIFNQIHNKDNGAHFAFLPLSQEEDQELLFNLILAAKKAAALYSRVRTIRANMTRVKLACEYDMGVVYSATPVLNWLDRVGKEIKGKGLGANYKAAIQLPAYKLRYGLGTETAVTEGGKKTMKDVTKDVYQGRQKAARSFKSILGVRAAGEGQKNEIVIAPRKHRGPFPVYATRDRELLKCYDIVDNKGTKTMKSNKKTISSMGVMT